MIPVITFRKIFYSKRLTLDLESYEDADGNILSVLFRKPEHEPGEDYFEATVQMIK